MVRSFALLCFIIAGQLFGAELTSVVAADPTSVPGADPAFAQAEVKASAFDGGAFLVWTDTRTGGLWPDVYGARVRFDGTVLEPSGIPIATGPREQESPDIACAASVCLAAWINRDRVEAARFAVDGTRIDLAPIELQIANGVHAVSVGTDGTSFVVVWSTSNNELDVQLVGADGALSGAVATLPLADNVRTTAVASDGQGWEIVWAEYQGTDGGELARSVLFTPPASFTQGPQILTTSSYPTFPMSRRRARAEGTSRCGTTSLRTRSPERSSRSASSPLARRTAER